jgi:small-conductance mechanosensitive channel
MRLLEEFRVNDILTPQVLFTLLRLAGIVIGGLLLLKLLSLVASRLTRKRLTPQTRMVVQKAIVYTGGVLILITFLSSLGVNLTALLGAAGIAGIAIGFASQTSISNLISGLFLISEKPFAVDDVIQVGDTSGVVLSIDLMSVKIRTFDNQFVRIPNQELLNTRLTNVTRFPIRRMDIRIRVSYRQDVRRVREVLRGLAMQNPYCLDEPEPLILFTDFGESSMDFLFGLWFVKSDFVVLKNSIMQQIKERFDAEGIEFAFPHRVLLTGAEPQARPAGRPPAPGAARGDAFQDGAPAPDGGWTPPARGGESREQGNGKKRSPGRPRSRPRTDRRPG